MTDKELKAYIEGIPCHNQNTGRINCENCIDGHLCSQYVKKGLRSATKFDAAGNATDFEISYFD